MAVPRLDEAIFARRAIEQEARVGPRIDPQFVVHRKRLERNIRLRRGGGCHQCRPCSRRDRKSDVWGKSVTGRVDLGGRGTLKKQTQYTNHHSCILSAINQTKLLEIDEI